MKLDNVVNLPNRKDVPKTQEQPPQSVCGGLKTPYLALRSAETLSNPNSTTY